MSRPPPVDKRRMKLILASGSRTRSQILAAAGLAFVVDPADIDERSIASPHIVIGASAEELAALLAQEKSSAVGARHLNDLTLGADQTLVCEGRLLNKPTSLHEAREQLEFLSGKTHELHAALCIVRRGQKMWSHVARASLKMRPLSKDFLSHYIRQMGQNATASVGGYQIEGLGIQLIEDVRGDHFTILGMPLLPLLAYLRSIGHLPS